MDSFTLLEIPRPQIWNGLNLTNLKLDQAYLNITSQFGNETLHAYQLSEDCHNCPFSYTTSVVNGSKILEVSSKHPSLWRIYNGRANDYIETSDKDKFVCTFNGNFDQFGVYHVIVEKDAEHCIFNTIKKPVDIYIPLLITTMGILLVYLIFKLFYYILCKNNSTQKSDSEESIQISEPSTLNEKKTNRILSIDAFRGFALCFMVFINDGGGQYWFLNHSTWNGLYFADVVFPWFLWVMGMCIALSQNRLSKIGFSANFRSITLRSVILFILGLSLNTLGVGPVYLDDLRILGVLQRIAICYFVVSSISLIVWKIESSIFSSFNSWAILIPQWTLHLLILSLHTYLTFYLVVPGCPNGYLGPGGIEENLEFENCTGGATGYIDKLILGEQHLYQNAPLRNTYHTKLPFDPENLLGCLTSIFGTFLGYHAGFILQDKNSKKKHKIYSLLFLSWIFIPIGLIIHFLNFIPLNKNLWSLSFTFTTSGLAFLVYAIFYYLIDCIHSWNGSPFIYSGMNSIMVYVGHELCFQLFPWHWKINHILMNTHLFNLLENIWSVLLWILITFILFKKKIFIHI